MSQIISLIIFFVSILGIGIILVRKIPVLVNLPPAPSAAPPPLSLRFPGLSKKEFLQKILSKIRTLSLKTDRQAAVWLQKLRTDSKKKSFGENDNYWQEVKKAAKNNDRRKGSGKPGALSYKKKGLKKRQKH